MNMSIYLAILLTYMEVVCCEHICYFYFALVRLFSQICQIYYYICHICWHTLSCFLISTRYVCRLVPYRLTADLLDYLLCRFTLFLGLPVPFQHRLAPDIKKCISKYTKKTYKKIKIQKFTGSISSQRLWLETKLEAIRFLLLVFWTL